MTTPHRLRTALIALIALPVAGFAVSAALASPDVAPAVTAEDEHPARATIAAAMKAAIAKDDNAYLETLHPDEVSNKTQRDQILRYSWKRFKGQVTWYLADDKDPSSFKIVKVDPTGEDRVRIFVEDLDHKNRMPVPVRLKKNPKGSKLAWGITANSL